MAEKIYVGDLVEEKAAHLYDRNGRLIGRNGSDDAEEYLALESFRGDRDTKQAIAAKLGILLDNYEHSYGETPPANIIASAVAAAEGLSSEFDDAVVNRGMALEAVSANVTLAENVAQILNIQNTLAMEYELTGILSQISTPFPSSVDETNLFEMTRAATKDWGTVSIGDKLGIEFAGGLSELDPVEDFPGDDATTAWPLTTGHPIAKDMMVLYLNMDPVGKDDGGTLSGTKVISAVTYTITGSITDYTDGTATVNVTPAMPTGNTLRVTKPLSLEDTNGEQYIQGLKYDSTKRTVKPQENALDVESTFHAKLAFQRNFNVDLQAYGERDLFRTINVDRGYNAIRQMYQASLFQPDAIAAGEDYNNDPNKSFKSVPPSSPGYTADAYIRSTLPRWLWMQDKELQTLSIFGFMTKMVVSDDFIKLIQMLPEGMFRPDPMYLPSKDIVFYGTLFGKYKIFYDGSQKIIPADEGLCIATSTDQLFHNGFLSSTAVPLNSFRFSMTKLMQTHHRLWGRFYRLLADPKYFRRFKIDAT